MERIPKKLSVSTYVMTWPEPRPHHWDRCNPRKLLVRVDHEEQCICYEMVFLLAPSESAEVEMEEVALNAINRLVVLNLDQRREEFCLDRQLRLFKAKGRIGYRKKRFKLSDEAVKGHIKTIMDSFAIKLLPPEAAIYREYFLKDEDLWAPESEELLRFLAATKIRPKAA